MTYWRNQPKPPMSEAERRRIYGPLVPLHSEGSATTYWLAAMSLLAAVVIGVLA